MPYHSLSDFLEELHAAGDLIRVSTPVNAELEIAEITSRCVAAGGPALLFDSINGHELPIVTNLLGTESRACRALGVSSLAALAERMSQLARPGGSASWLDRLRGPSDGPPIDKFRPKTARQGACQQAVRLGRDIDLTALPAIRSWPGESGRCLTGRLIFGGNDGQATTARHVRAVVVDRKHLAISGLDINGLPPSPCAKPGESIPAALALGGDPAGTLATVFDWVNVDAYVLAGLLRNQPWDVVPARSLPLLVPADADMVIEGVLRQGNSPAEETSAALTLGHDTSGYYGDPVETPWTFEVSAVTQRANPILPIRLFGDLSAGYPTGETAVLQAVSQCLLEPILKAAIPELTDCSFAGVGGATSFVVLAIRKTYAGQARRVASAFWGLIPLERTKCVVIVDDDIDVHSGREVLSRIAANVSPDRDVFLQAGPGNPGDHSARHTGLGQHLGIDATAKLSPEHPRPWPARLERPADLRDAVTRRWAEYGLPSLDGKP